MSALRNGNVAPWPYAFAAARRPGLRLGVVQPRYQGAGHFVEKCNFAAAAGCRVATIVRTVELAS